MTPEQIQELRRLEAEDMAARDLDNPVQKLAAVECVECVGTKEVPIYLASGEREQVWCPTCQGTGKKYWQLWEPCRHPGFFSTEICHKRYGDCFGTGYVLRPEAEWMGILVRIADDIGHGLISLCGPKKYGTDVWLADAIRKHSGETDGEADTPEAALAEAIYQAQEG